MSKLLKTVAAAAALLAAAPAVSAQSRGGAELARYDARAASSLAEQLVLCDLVTFFSNGPDLDAQSVHVRRDANYYEPVPPLAITRGQQWYDVDLQRAYFRYRAAGRVDSAQVLAARRNYGMEMERIFRRTRPGERRFFESQARFCKDLARASWRTASR
jgi:hypothetical protein